MGNALLSDGPDGPDGSLAPTGTKEPSRRVSKAAHRRGTVKVSIAQKRVPRLPHEHDESSDSQAGEPLPVMQQAATDLKRGLEDTDRGPQTNRISKKLKGGP